MSNEHEIPFQIEHLIKSLLNKSENIHIRGNFRVRLDTVRKAIETAIRKYDDELVMTENAQFTGRVAKKRR